MLGELFWLILGGSFVAKEVLTEKSQKKNSREYLASNGYDIEKQFEVSHLATSYNPKDREEFSSRLGRPYVYKDYWSHEEAVKEIAKKEGWQYFDRTQVYNDPEYLKIIGAKNENRFEYNN